MRYLLILMAAATLSWPAPAVAHKLTLNSAHWSSSRYIVNWFGNDQPSRTFKRCFWEAPRRVQCDFTLTAIWIVGDQPVGVGVAIRVRPSHGRLIAAEVPRAYALR